MQTTARRRKHAQARVHWRGGIPFSSCCSCSALASTWLTRRLSLGSMSRPVQCTSRRTCSSSTSGFPASSRRRRRSRSSRRPQRSSRTRSRAGTCSSSSTPLSSARSSLPTWWCTERCGVRTNTGRLSSSSAPSTRRQAASAPRPPTPRASVAPQAMSHARSHRRSWACCTTAWRRSPTRGSRCTCSSRKKAIICSSRCMHTTSKRHSPQKMPICPTLSAT